MNANHTSQAQELYRHRYALDRIKYSALYASNRLGYEITGLLVPDALKPTYELTLSSRKILSDVLKDVRQRQISYQQHLAPLKDDAMKALEDLDNKLVAHESAAHQWLLSNLKHSDVRGEPPANWIYFDESIWMTLHFRPELDDVSAVDSKLFLDWRFASLTVNLCPGQPDRGGLPSQFFQFGKWADDNLPADRPEVHGLRSELLKAFLPYVPEAAFLAGYVSKCSLTLQNKRRWQTPALSSSTLEKP